VIRASDLVRRPPAAVAAAVAAVAVVACASALAARSPRLERLALNAADTRLAAGAVLRRADLAGVPPGWRPLATTPDDSAPVCPWQDYSHFTVTGRAQAGFQAAVVGGSGYVGSTVEIYASAADAEGRFDVDVHPGTAGCESQALRQAFGASLKIVGARRIAMPGLGERATSFRFVYAQTKEPKRIYVNVIELVRGRGVAVLDTTNFDTAGSSATRLALARVVDRRLG
jgi:hypothetical protein